MPEEKPGCGSIFVRGLGRNTGQAQLCHSRLFYRELCKAVQWLYLWSARWSASEWMAMRETVSRILNCSLPTVKLSYYLLLFYSPAVLLFSTVLLACSLTLTVSWKPWSITLVMRHGIITKGGLTSADVFINQGHINDLTDTCLLCMTHCFSCCGL